VLGVLPANSKRLVEEAFDSNPCIQEWFLELDELPDHVPDEIDDGDVVAESLRLGNAFRYESKNPHDRQLQELADFMHECGVFEDEADSDLDQDQDSSPSDLLQVVEQATTPIAATDVQADVARPAWRGAKMKCDFIFAQSGATTGKRSYPLPSTPPESPNPSNEEDRFGQEDNYVFIRCDVSDIPSGLCRLEVQESGHKMKRYYPRLERIADRWIFKESIEVILNRLPDPQTNVEVAIVTATAETRHEFSGNETVREAMAEWPPESTQRQLAEEFLNEKDLHE
jgi:hypothetical protein